MTYNQSKSKSRAAVAARVVLGLLCLGWVGAAQATGVGDFVVDSSKAAGLQNCVEPTEYMRRNHMEVIRHQRDTTVYGGIRSTKHSLAGCVECHVGYDAEHKPVAINNDGQFCTKCHEYTAVKLNCFDCHATIPEGESWNQVTAAAHPELLPGVEQQPIEQQAASAAAAAPAEGRAR